MTGTNAQIIMKVGEGWADLLEFAGFSRKQALERMVKRYGKEGIYNPDSGEIEISINCYITVSSVPLSNTVYCYLNIEQNNFEIVSQISGLRAIYMYWDKEFSKMESKPVTKVSDAVVAEMLKNSQDYIREWSEPND